MAFLYCAPYQGRVKVSTMHAGTQKLSQIQALVMIVFTMDTVGLFSHSRKEIINDRVQEHSADTNTAAKKLDRIQRLAKNDCNSNDNNNPLKTGKKCQAFVR